MTILLIIGLLLGLSIVIFALQNVTHVAVAFLGWHFDTSLTLIVILVAASAILLSSLTALPDVIRKSLQISKLKKHNKKLAEIVVEKEMEVEEEKSKVDATNAYLDELEKTP